MGVAVGTRTKKDGEPPDLWDYVEKVGPYQIMFFALGFFPALLNGIQAVNFSFTEAVPNLRCCNPALENCTAPSALPFNSPEFNSSQTRSAYWYAHEKGKYCDFCPGGSRDVNGSGTCGAENSIPCNASFVFDQSLFPSSAVLDFRMYCDRDWMYELVQTLFLGGYCFSGLISGLAADRFGRRPTFLAAAFFSLLSYIFTPLSPWYGLYAFLSFLNGLISDAAYLTSFILLMEISDSRWRTVLGLLYQCFFSVAYPLVGGLAPALKGNWKILYWVVSSPVLVFVAYIWLFPESLRWTVSKRKEQQTWKELARFKRWNKKADIPDEVVLEALSEKEKGEETQPRESFLEVFKHPSTTKNTLILFFTWIVAAMSYYGLALNTDDLPGNVYENFILSGMADILGYLITIPLLEYWGRRPPLVLYWLVGGTGCIASGLIPAGNTSAIVGCAMVGKICVASAFALVYNYTSELYPTSMRQTACGLCSMFAHFGAMAAPQIHLLVDVGPQWLPIVIFGALALTAAALNIFLPETKGRAMPQTIAEAVQIARGLPLHEAEEEKESPTETIQLEEKIRH